MKRRHLFEFEDQRWFPAFLRDAITDFLSEALVVGKQVYTPVLPLLTKLLERQGSSCIVDLCSGGCGPWPSLKGQLDAKAGSASLVLTDKYPNVAAFRRAAETIDARSVTFSTAPVDATDVPSGLKGVRTLFTSFHHLRPATAKQVLADAFRQRCAIGVFEFTERRWAIVLGSIVLAPLFVLLSVPRHRPVRLSRLLATFVVPVVPLAAMWDSVVSNLRTYLPAELHEMVADLTAEDYAWEIGQLTGNGGPPITYLLGFPTTRRDETA
ncbi:MAG: hypothetical protein ACRDS1_15450 [Pseudonocardiaceae bacterium]